MAAKLNDITPVKTVKTIYCRTCHKHLENTKDRYKLFGAQELGKTLENILDATVEPNIDDDVDYICSSCRSKIIRFSKVDKEYKQNKQFFKESNNSEFIPALVRLKRGRKTPPNASQVSQGPRGEPRIASKALRSINFSNQPGAQSFSSQNVATISSTASTAASTSYLSHELPASVEVRYHLPSSSIVNNNYCSKSTQTSARRDTCTHQDNIEEKLVITSHWKSKTQKKTLPKSLRKLGLSLVRKINYKAIASAAISNKELEKAIVKNLAFKVSKEMRKLCKMKNLLKDVKPRSLMTFSIKRILKEWKKFCPTFYSFLHSAAVPVKFSKSQKKKYKAPMLMAGSILFRCWNNRMSALQHIIGIILHESHTKRTGFERLSKLGICTVKATTNKKLKEMSKGHDMPISTWKQKVEASACSETQVHMDMVDPQDQTHIDDDGSSGTTEITSSAAIDDSAIDITEDITADVDDGSSDTTEIYTYDAIEDNAIDVDDISSGTTEITLSAAIEDSAIDITEAITADVDDGSSGTTEITLSAAIEDSAIDITEDITADVDDGSSDTTEIYTYDAIEDNAIDVASHQKQLPLNAASQDSSSNSTAKPTKKYDFEADNCDFEVKPTIYCSSKDTKSIHGVCMLGIEQRVLGSELNNTHQIQSVLDLPNISFLPSIADHQALSKELIVMILRVLVKYCKWFKQYSKHIPQHIQHAYTAEMKKCNDVILMRYQGPVAQRVDTVISSTAKIQLGYIDKNENCTQEMVEILRLVHANYVPTTKVVNEFDEEEDIIVERVMLGGDQLTIERAIGAMGAVMDADTPYQQLKGIIPAVEDFHCEMNILQMTFDLMYHQKSISDHGTLYQLKTRLNRKDVKEKVTSSYHGCEAFFSDVLDGYILLAVMKHFGMESLDSKPTENILPEEPDGIASIIQLHKEARKILNEFVYPEKRVSEIRQNVQQQDVSVDSYGCRYPTCNREFVREGNRDNHEANVHQLVITDHHQEKEVQKKESKEDHIFNYSKTVLLLGLLHRNFQDAVKEGDGERVTRMWKHLLLYFRARNKTKYALESLFLHVQLNAILTPREAHCLKWNRTVNTKGGTGKNIARDLVMEHTIKTTKNLFASQGAMNFNMEGAMVYSRSTNAMKSVIENFDIEGSVKKRSSKHVYGSRDTDITTIVEELTKINALSNLENGREHQSFPNFKEDMLADIDSCKLHKWINDHKKYIHNFWE